MDDDSAAAVLLVVKKPRARLKTPPAPHRARSAPLAELCRAVVSTNLERYPPESFGICDPDEWQAIVKFRHASTQPKQRVTASTGLEGRIVPAVAEKVLQAIEDCNPHLAECPVTDTLLWKDCVEYRYRRGCLTRPVALHLPWPLLVQELQGQADLLLQSEVSSEEMRHAIDTLRRSPMNVSLLKDSQVGKTVKRVVKFSTALNDNAKTELRDLLVSWMEMATSDSADVDGAKKDIRESFTQDDLNLAETCYSWRQLFAALHHRNDEIRSIQGKRMREIRKNLADTRPKLVKVRPNTAQQERMLERLPVNDRVGGNAKVAQLRKETTIQLARQRASATARPKASFGDAVAFASVSKKGMAHKRKQLGGTIQQLGNGKRMKVPTKVVQGAGPRQFASKWKATKK